MIALTFGYIFYFLFLNLKNTSNLYLNKKKERNKKNSRGFYWKLMIFKDWLKNGGIKKNKKLKDTFCIKVFI